MEKSKKTLTVVKANAMGKFALCMFLMVVFSTSALVVAGPSDSLEIIWENTYYDSVTGDNEFIASNNKHYWFVNEGADVYNNDLYERPVTETVQNQTYGNSNNPGMYRNNIGKTDRDELFDTLTEGSDILVAVGTSNPSYHAYLDIVTGSYGLGGVGDNDEGFVFFQIELYGDYRAGENDFDDADGVFGDDTLYNVRVSDNAVTGEGGLLIGTSAQSDLGGDKYDGKWNNEKTYIDWDKNTDVGGTAITTPEEEFAPSNLEGDGYEENITTSDGETENGDKETVLWTRYREEDGRYFVELALDLATLRSELGEQFFDTDLLGNGGDLVFETDRGLKDNSNYLWNDEYQFSQARDPYGVVAGYAGNLENMGNVYELDNLRAGSPVVIPAPGALLLAGIGAGLVGQLRRRRLL